jgi:hypothetical protein
MQLTPAQRRFYIDPVQDATIITDQILVTEERSSRQFHIDKVVAVRPKRFLDQGRHWWITEGGDYVYGAPVNPADLSYRPVIAPGGDGWFYLGNASRRLTDGYVVTGMLRSDGRRLPGEHGIVSTMEATLPVVVKAASWAGELFPQHGDSDEVVRAKLALAEQRWNHRRAKAEIIRQGIHRGWHDDLVELRDSGKLPSATFGATYKGKVMIEAANPPAADSLSLRDNNRLQELRDAAKVTNTDRPAVMLGIDVDVPLQSTFEEFDEVRKMPLSTVIHDLRNAVNDYTAMPGLHAITPVLRSIA